MVRGVISIRPRSDAADVNDDEKIEIADAVIELQFLFLGGPPPEAPYPGCDVDPTTGAGDTLGCGVVVCP